MAAQDAPAATVKFNAGGRLFETSRGLFDQHEETMLGRLISDTWLEDSGKPIFIDRDGDIFARVLNFLRYGSVTLPGSIPKDMFLRDLDFFGIPHETGTVLGETEKFPLRAKEMLDELKELETKKYGMMLQQWLSALTFLCCAEYVYGRKQVVIEKTTHPNLYSVAVQLNIGQVTKNVFDKMLSQFGLSFQKMHINLAKNNAGYRYHIQFDDASK